MVKIYFESDDKGYVDGWGSTRSKDDEVELEIDMGHDFFESDSHAWKYVEGNLIFDEERNKELLEENDKKEAVERGSPVNCNTRTSRKNRGT
ncbi:hypothetical protein RWE15_23805 [Virgibacillus halophilus]|uniref:Uncharacterized protein n=1 Tax=Tigheibacillus halophilus TaxID=361280 RepID=A0ABU5CD79_9BACI|nr:hypothetical protein [Virgibacillus halophilus]